MDEKEHVHCIICSKPMDTDEISVTYVCSDCVQTFSSEYIAHRIDCENKGITKKEFDILEYRLTFGASRPIPKDLFVDNYVFHIRERKIKED